MLREEENREEGELGRIFNFDKLSSSWWDKKGPMRILHAQNKLRVDYIKRHLISHYSLDADTRFPLEGLRILDLGCGGGIASESLGRLGGVVTGLDTSINNIEIASKRALAQGLDIKYIHIDNDYRHLQEKLASESSLDPGSIDALVCLEVVEHIEDLGQFLDFWLSQLRSGSCLFISTINKTYSALLIAKLGAEYILGLLPRGTHSYANFVSPHRLQELLSTQGVVLQDITGIVYSLCRGEWELKDFATSINYITYGIKK